LPINLEQFLYQNKDEGDIPLVVGDVIVIPYRQYYIITGEVNTSREMPLGSLVRLSSLLLDLTERASSRFVTVTSSGGAVVNCDLFLARRFGDMSQDPYIFPGDIIRVLPMERTVGIFGKVYRPGNYELLPDDDLERLVSYYAGGRVGEVDKIQLYRLNPNTGLEESRIFSYQENLTFQLQDGDRLVVGVVDPPDGLFRGNLF
jgi:protein involved in polysaccharide export with SLBB domain